MSDGVETEVREWSEILRNAPYLIHALNQPYSPNHTAGQTTAEHIRKQLEMAALLTRGDFDGLAGMVANPDASAQMEVKGPDLRDFFEPLLSQLNSDDWQILILLVGFHDLGKLDRTWAQSNLDVTDVEWLAHDQDSATLLGHNPELLDEFELNQIRRDALIEMCRLHSLPGQFFFGEGNVSAWQPLADQFQSSLAIARVHGLIDAMSALNHRFVKPILASHVMLSDLIDRAFKTNQNLESLFREMSRNQFENECALPVPIGPVTWRRLRLLLGDKCSPEQLVTGLDSLQIEFVTAMDGATDGEQTWFGTYVANGFGSGMLEALKDDTIVATAVQVLVKVLASAASHMEHRMEWTVGALKPALRIAEARANAKEIQDYLSRCVSIESCQSLLAGGGPVALRAGRTGIEIC